MNMELSKHGFYHLCNNFLEGQHGVEVVAFNTKRKALVTIMSHGSLASGTNISPRLTQISPENSPKPGCKYTLSSPPEAVVAVNVTLSINCDYLLDLPQRVHGKQAICIGNVGLVDDP